VCAPTQVLPYPEHDETNHEKVLEYA